ncbi:MAG: glycosyltransferase [Granulosicoccus sp.]
MNTSSQPSTLPDIAHMPEPVIAFAIEALTIGGAEQMLIVLANEFALRGWQVHLICLSQAGELATQLEDSVQLHVLHKRRGIDVGLPRRVCRCIDQINPDVINSHLWVANAWIRLSLLARSIPVVVTEHSRDTWKPSGYRWIDKWLSRRTYRLVAVSHDTAVFYEHSIGVDKRLVSVINNGVDTERYAAGSGEILRQQWLNLSRSDVSDRRTPFLVGTVGRLVSAKNHQRLIDAVALLIKDDELADKHDIRLYIVGEGPERPRLERHIDQLGLNEQIVLAGLRHDIPDVLAAFDVFVLSSDREGHPLTALEAQAAGTPVVLTNAGGSADAIASRNGQVGGVLVTQSKVALADAIGQMVLDPRLCKERAQFARAFALENFDKHQMIDRYEAVFRSAFENARL